MNNIYLRCAYPNELYHHGIKGQKWGVRRYQNPDGSLTPAGRKRYLNADGSLTRKGLKFLNANESERENRRNALRTESLKGTKAQNAVDDLRRMGFNDDGSGISDRWMAKKVSTKHGTVEVFTAIDRNSSNPVNGEDMKLALSSLKTFGTPALKNMKRELQDSVQKGEWGDGGVHISGLNSMYVSKFNNDTIICELSAPVKDNKTGNTYGWFSIDVDPKTGKMYHISYND